MAHLGRALIVAGCVLVGLGVLLTVAPRLPFSLGRLPGDIEIRGPNRVAYFPLMTCLILSALLSLVAWLVGRFR